MDYALDELGAFMTAVQRSPAASDERWIGVRALRNILRTHRNRASWVDLDRTLIASAMREIGKPGR